ncbi:hypothetical protein [Caudoviricetes sp.]|nr:hypothetical protein [Caudoviricetes sp.]
MSWVAVAVGGAALVSGVVGAQASKSAANTAAKGDAAGIAEQQRQFDTIMQLQRPYSVAGTGAMNQLAKLYGLPYSPYSDAATMGGGQGYSGSGIPSSSSGQSTANKLFNVKSGSFSPISDTNMLSWGGYSYQAPADTDPNAVNGIVTPSGPDMSGFFASPDYNFRRTEGQRGIEQSAAARGGAFSGNALKALNQYNSNLAAGEYGDYFNRLASMAGIGQTATNNQSAAAMNTGNNISEMLRSQADTRASGIMGSANSWSNALNSGLNNYLMLKGY